MSKIKDYTTLFFAQFFTTIFGTSIRSFAFRIAIGLFGLWGGSATNFGDAVGIVLDKERSIATAVELINETPPAEVAKAAEAEEVKTDEVIDAIATVEDAVNAAEEE